MDTVDVRTGDNGRWSPKENQRGMRKREVPPDRSGGNGGREVIFVGNYGAEETNTLNTRERANAWLISRDNDVNGRFLNAERPTWFLIVLLFLDSSVRDVKDLYNVVTLSSFSLDASRLMRSYRYFLGVSITITINIHSSRTLNK